MLKSSFIAALFAVLPAVSLAAGSAPSIPDTPAGHALSEWLEAFNSGDRATYAAFEKAHAPWLELDEEMESRKRTGGYDLLNIGESDGFWIDFRAKERASSAEAVGRLIVRSYDPGHITLLSLESPDESAKQMTVDEADRSRVMDGAVKLLNQFYVFPDVAEKVAAKLRAERKRGAYRNITDAETFAIRLSDDLVALSGDKHIGVDFFTEADPNEAPSRPHIDPQLLGARNCGLETADHYPPNIGYLKIERFDWPEYCAPTAIAAMNFLADSDALIIDLRVNYGGAPEMAALISSYLFDERTHLDDIYDRGRNTTEQFWTFPHLPGKKLTGKPIFILTSARTFSVGEQFSYDLKVLKRATLIGETTGGGAHPIRPHRIDDHFFMRAAFGRFINPVTKTNWERVGVEPDVKVPADEALDVARKLAAEAVNKDSTAEDPLAASKAPPRPAPAPVIPVTETLWGQQVTDNYRYMEALDARTLTWMKAQSAYTRSILDAIPLRAALETRIAAFTGSFGLTRGYMSYGGRAFYEERLPGSDNFDLVVSDKAGKRKLVDLAAVRAANAGKSHAINYFLASPDGSKVAAGISQGGSEAASIFVYDTATGKQIAGPVDRADPGFTTWSSDSSTLYFSRLKKLAAGDADVEKYRNPTLVSWDLKSEPVTIFGSTVGRGLSFLPDELPTLSISPGTSVAMAVSINGMQPEQAVWLAPVSRVNDPNVKWTPFVARRDDVKAVAAAGDTLYLLSHRNAPTFQVLSVEAGKPLAAARVLVPAEKDRVLDAIHAAADALYVLARQGAYSRLLRVPHASGKIEEVALPFKGLIQEAFADPRQPGITINLQSFVVPPTTFAYDPAKKKFTDLKLGVTAPYDSGRYEVSDLEARAQDGVMVPNTLVRPKSAKGPQIVLIQAYGWYGISQLANFSFRAVSFLEAGGTYASCHVRGGGELGEAWRLAGKDANKPNTWRDLIACAEDLIARGYTTKDELFILGGSGGGTTVGRAMTERPDLFAGVIALVPGANALRQEFQPSGPINIPESGTITTQEGFKNLYEMDTIRHVRFGVQYPPVLVTTGLNDPRAAPWEAAQLVAALQASGTARPILLRVHAEAGHGIASTKSQDDALYADMWTFVFWHAGLPDWKPRF